MNFKIDVSYDEVWDCTNIDRRLEINFPSLNAEEEKFFTNELLNFIGYYLNHQEEIDNRIAMTGKPVNYYSKIEYWNKCIGKSEKLEIMLTSLPVISSAINYWERMQKFIDVIGCIQVHKLYPKRTFRSEETGRRLRSIMTVMEQIDPITHKEILQDMNDKMITPDHISENEAKEYIRMFSPIEDDWT